MRSITLLLFWCAALPGAAPVSLREAVKEALANNASLLASKADISVAEARILTARLRPNPQGKTP